MTDESSFEERPPEETDLASRHLGATVLAASDESFGEKENLLNPAPPNFEPGNYGNRGEIVDGWETRRRREPGHDWVIVRLGAAGKITGIDVDTSFFTGNYPETCSVEACGVEGYPGVRPLQSQETGWTTLVPGSALTGGQHNVFSIADEQRFTHVRLSVFPDGGVARLRIFGRVLSDPRDFDGMTVDLVSERNGGYVSSCSDGYYSSPRQLIRPDEARVMGDGWETRRRRENGNDFVTFGLGIAGRPCQVVVDTSRFRYNASDSVALWGSNADIPPPLGSGTWSPILSETKLEPDTRHVFRLGDTNTICWARLDAFPDGGLARLRVIGDVDPAARKKAGLRFFNSLPNSHAVSILADSRVGPDAAVRLARRRPLTEGTDADLESLAPLLYGRTRGE